VCGNVYEFLKQRGHEPERDIIPACTFYEYDNNGAIRLHSVFDNNVENTSITIVHETVHLVNMIFQHTGIRPDLNNDELQAYLTGFIFDKINKYVNG
jgi:hypothetical protein